MSDIKYDRYRYTTGPRGPIGQRGPMGPRGRTGERGRDGRDGKNGIKGERGDSGLKGERGERGDIGPPGHPGICSECTNSQKQVPVINKFLYPSTRIYSDDPNYLSLEDVGSYNQYEQNGWVFRRGTLSFPVKNNTDIDDIKGISVNLYTKTTLENFTVSLITNSKITYSLCNVLRPNTSYQFTTHHHNYLYDESLICLHKISETHGHCETPVYRIEIHKEDDEREIIITSITIIYEKCITNFYCLSL
jgi:hypothetical protein